MVIETGTAEALSGSRDSSNNEAATGLLSLSLDEEGPSTSLLEGLWFTLSLDLWAE